MDMHVAKSRLGTYDITLGNIDSAEIEKALAASIELSFQLQPAVLGAAVVDVEGRIRAFLRDFIGYHRQTSSHPMLPKIQAIKFVRTLTGWGLVDAKNFVEANGF